MEKEKDGEDTSSQKSAELTYEDVLEQMGSMGRFQICMFVLLVFPFCTMALTISSFVFTHAIPEYRCHVPGCDNESLTVYNPPWLNMTIPEEGAFGSSRLSRCRVFNYTWHDTAECYADPPTNETVECDTWVFDTSTYGSSIVTEFELTCENEWFQPIVGAIFMIGMLVGAVIFGPISDKYGRKVAFVSSVTWMSIFAIATAFSPNLIVFAILRFLTGLGSVGCFLSAFVWGIEFVGIKYVIICGFIFQSAGTIASIGFTGIAYICRDWKILQLVSGVPSLIFISYWWIIPESPRWLLSNGKYEQARKTMQKVAKFNKRTVPEETLNAFFHQAASQEKSLQSAETGSIAGGTEGKRSVFETFRSPVLRKRAFIMFAAWVAGDMCYYGLSMTSAYLSGDFYVNFILSMVVELPSYFIGVFFMDKLGRRATLVLFLFIGGISCLIAGFSPEDIAVLATVFSLIGKFSASLILANVYSYTAELFPTSNRSAIVGMCSTCGRVGAILAPVLASTARIIFLALPFLIFGLVSVIVGLLTLTLPETLGVGLPSTLEEAIELEKYTISCRRSKRKKSTDSS